MLTKGANEKPLFIECQRLMDSLGLRVVEVTQSMGAGSATMRVVLYKSGAEIDTGDLEKAYNIIYPRYSATLSRDLELEVSSPGMQRNFKDESEFAVFTGRTVRVYVDSLSSYVTGKIENAGKDGVTLTSYLVEDRKESGDAITLDYGKIGKAKLECVWEKKND